MPNTPHENPSKKYIKTYKETSRTTQKPLQINPTYKQASHNNTTLYARTSMIKHGESKIQEPRILPSPKSYGKMEI